MRVIQLLLTVLALLVVLTGCSTADPYPERFYTSGGYDRVSTDGFGGYWHEYNLNAFSASPGSSGATLVLPSAVTVGGYRLDAVNDYLYFTTHVEDDWGGYTSGLIEIDFELGVDNSGGAVDDVVVLTAVCHHQSEGSAVVDVATHSGTVTVGQGAQYTMFAVTIAVPDVTEGETISFRLNLDTVASDVDDVIINYLEFKYASFHPAMER